MALSYTASAVTCRSPQSSAGPIVAAAPAGYYPVHYYLLRFREGETKEGLPAILADPQLQARSDRLLRGPWGRGRQDC